MTLKFRPRLIRRALLMAAALLLANHGDHRRPDERYSPGPSPRPPATSGWSTTTGRWWSARRDGDFVARPIFSRPTDVLFYSIRHPDTGEWVTNTYRVKGGEKQLSEGWEYTFEYPVLNEQPELDPEQAFLLVLAVPRTGGGDHHVFHALIPVHQPKGLWDRVLGALDPDRWARAGATWVIQGVHGTLCGVLEGVTNTQITECG